MIDLLDSEISLQEKAASRHIQLETLWRRKTFEPKPKWETTKEETIYPHTWVDVKSKGEVKSRFTVADSVKRLSLSEKPEGPATSSPTPHPESHIGLEVYALKHGLVTRPFDIVCAFTIGMDPGDAEGRPVLVRTCSEHQPFIEEWCKKNKPE